MAWGSWSDPTQARRQAGVAAYQDYWNEKDWFPAIDLDGKEFVYVRGCVSFPPLLNGAAGAHKSQSRRK
jgi:hypothetical protein